MSPDEIRRQNSRLRATLADRCLSEAYISGHQAALGIALQALVGAKFAKARLLITDVILREIDSLVANQPRVGEIQPELGTPAQS